MLSWRPAPQAAPQVLDKDLSIHLHRDAGLISCRYNPPHWQSHASGTSLLTGLFTPSNQKQAAVKGAQICAGCMHQNMQGGHTGQQNPHSTEM